MRSRTNINAAERKILDDIDEHGCHVLSVFDPAGNDPTFSYSVGLKKTFAREELIVVGVRPELGHALINEYRDRISAGDIFEPRVPYSGFLEGFQVYFETVAIEHRESYMLSDCWLYGGSDLEALQLVYPTTSGVWPWEPGASEWFLANQPCLAPHGWWTTNN